MFAQSEVRGEKAYVYWVDLDDTALVRLFEVSHFTIKDIATILHRSKGAINSRLKKLGVRR